MVMEDVDRLAADRAPREMKPRAFAVRSRSTESSKHAYHRCFLCLAPRRNAWSNDY